MQSFLVALLAIVTAEAVAQDSAAIPCKASTCVLKIDWGGNKTSSDYPPDKRYGSGDDFERRFVNALKEKGLLFQLAPLEGAVTMVARTTMAPRVMCDAMAGISTDKTCTAMTLLAVSFTAPPGGQKAPSAMRITNRCAAGDIYLSHRDFADFAAQMIWYQLEGQAAKGERPRSNC